MDIEDRADYSNNLRMYFNSEKDENVIISQLYLIDQLLTLFEVVISCISSFYANSMITLAIESREYCTYQSNFCFRCVIGKLNYLERDMISTITYATY